MFSPLEKEKNVTQTAHFCVVPAISFTLKLVEMFRSISKIKVGHGDGHLVLHPNGRLAITQKKLSMIQ